MGTSEEKLSRLIRQSWYLVVAFVIYAVAGVLLLGTFALLYWVSNLILEPLYGMHGTWYVRLGLHIVKGALFYADVYVFVLFVRRAVDHVKRDS